MTDQYAHFDGAYVLGALSDEERASFEQHLETCVACRQRVAEVAGLPALMSGITVDELEGDDVGAVPDTLLPSLVREVRASRRRRTLFAAAGAVAAACIAAVIAFALATGSSTSSTPNPGPALAGQVMRPLVTSPIHASVGLAAQPWGTQVTMRCRYVESGSGPGDDQHAYAMTVIDRSGVTHPLGSWRIGPGETLTFTAPTSLSKSDITRVNLTLPGGKPILRANV